jgi:hypothetical protein
MGMTSAKVSAVVFEKAGRLVLIHTPQILNKLQRVFLPRKISLKALSEPRSVPNKGGKS